MNIDQIARLARVSTATVSRVINNSPSVREKTAERLRKVIAEAGYVPNQNARTLSSGRSQLFGVVISDITNPFFPELVSSFERLCMGQSYDTILANTNYDVQRLYRCLVRMVERRVDGIAIFTSEMDDQSAEMLLRHKVPVATLAYGVRDNSFHTIQVDYTRGMNMAVQHLAQFGHTKIAFIAGPHDLWTGCQRLKDFSAIMSKSCLPLPPERIVEGNNRLDGGAMAMQRLLNLKQRPTAVICSNDLMAVGALQTIHEAGLSVPADLSLVGFDDLQMVSLTNPPLTSVQISRTEIASMAFQTLLSATNDSQLKKRKCVLNTKLILRQSTARPSRKKRKNVHS